MMRRARGSQRDLFDDALRVVELRPDLRTKLTPLLQALLSEAAGLQHRQSRLDDLGDEEAGDDQDHA
jgi:hypothetical protein